MHEISIRPNYSSSSNTGSRYSGNSSTYGNDDKTLSGGDLTMMFFMVPISNIANYLLKHI